MDENTYRRYAETLMRHRINAPGFMDHPDYKGDRDAICQDAVKVGRTANHLSQTDAEVLTEIEVAIAPAIKALGKRYEGEIAAEERRKRELSAVRSDSGLTHEQHEAVYGNLDPLPKTHPDYRGLKSVDIIPVESPETGETAKPEPPKGERAPGYDEDKKPIPLKVAVTDPGLLSILEGQGLRTLPDLLEMADATTNEGGAFDPTTIEGIDAAGAEALAGYVQAVGIDVSAWAHAEPAADSSNEDDADDSTPAPIEDLGLRKQIVAALQDNGVKTIPELAKAIEDGNGTLTHFNGIKDASMSEIGAAFEAYIAAGGDGKAKPAQAQAQASAAS